MSNTSLGKGIKGSKYWMDTCVENAELRKKLNNLVGQELEWICPLPEENFREYELNQLKDLFGMSADEMKTAFSFWPSRQPQWDGIAIGESNNIRTLYIIEAKAHTTEMISTCKASPKSVILIEKSLREIHDKYYADADFDMWMYGYYQLANRLTFYHKLKEMNLFAFDDIKLVLLNFVNDKTYRSTDKDTWEKFMQAAFRNVTKRENPPEGVMELFLDVGDYC